MLGHKGYAISVDFLLLSIPFTIRPDYIKRTVDMEAIALREKIRHVKKALQKCNLYE